MAEKTDSGCEMDFNEGETKPDDGSIKENGNLSNEEETIDLIDNEEMIVFINTVQDDTSTIDLSDESFEIVNNIELVNSETLDNENETHNLDLKNFATWDPLLSTDWDCETATALCIGRLKRDLTNVYSEKNPMMSILPEENNITKIHAVISGPLNTPYEGGFFYFFMRAPPNYPLVPPRVKLMTTGQGIVRFNPNLYKNGKVCLSTLGTWSGPGWSAANSLFSLLLSIQSLLNEKPYHNEPGFHVERKCGDSNRYNLCIIHETLRVASCDMADGCLANQIPDSLQELIEKNFLIYKEHYLSIVDTYKYLDGTKFEDPFAGGNRGIFKFAELAQRVNEICEKLTLKHGSFTESSYEGSDTE